MLVWEKDSFVWKNRSSKLKKKKVDSFIEKCPRHAEPENLLPLLVLQNFCKVLKQFNVGIQ